MKILFIYPNLYAQIGFNYGIAFLSAMLKQRGHETRLINVNDQLNGPLDLEAIRREVLTFRPEAICFSITTNQHQYARLIARSIRSYWDAPLVAGGIHITMTPEEVFKEGEFDYLCVGEGEEALVELVDELEKGGAGGEIANIWSRHEDEMVANPVRPFVRLENLPRKDYEIFDFQRLVDAKDGWVGVMTSRGCPFHCSYCFNHRIMDRYRQELNLSAGRIGYIRRHPIPAAIEELEYLLSHYRGIDTFIFDDDLFTHDKEYLSEFCREYRQTIRLPFVVNAHVRKFDREAAVCLKEAGCKLVKFGLESGSPRIRTQVLRRPMKDEEIARAFDVASRAGLSTSAFVMIGLPQEGSEDIEMTLELLARVRPNRFRWALFFPYVGTEAYELSRREGLIDEEKLRSLPSFTEESCLDFGREHNLFLKRLKRAFPWYVNACSPDPLISNLYRQLIRLLEDLGEKEPDQWKKEVLSLDSELSHFLSLTGREHYVVRYNDFMAVKERTYSVPENAFGVS